MAIPQRPELEEIPLPESPGLLGGWGRKLELTLLRFLLQCYNTVMAPFWNARDQALKYLFQSIEDELKPVITPLLDRIDSVEGIPPEIKAMTNHLRFSEPITFAAIAASIIMAAIVGLFMGLVQPFQRLIAQEVSGYVHPSRMGPPEAVTALLRGLITRDEYHNQLSDQGWSERLEEVFEKLLAPLLPVGDLTRLYVRGEISEEELDESLAGRGYNPGQVQHIKTLLHVIPGLSDIIRMAVREAFSPQAVSTFQLYAELPGEMVEWAEKQGLSREWAEAYWAAHWELPSLTMGFEMLHRGEIGEEEMKLLIKAHDLSPFWRDKLLNISYAPYTRVDVRRMFECGVLGVEEVYQSYRDIGYNHEKATNMTAFTVALSNATERDLTKSEVLNGYKIGFFNEEEAGAQLANLGYDASEVNYYLSKVNYDLWQAQIKETVKYLEQQYTVGIIGQQEVYSELGRLNLPSEQVNRYIRDWDIKKEAKTKRLTAAQLVKFAEAGVIKAEDFANEMSGLGYCSRYVEWYLNSIDWS